MNNILEHLDVAGILDFPADKGAFNLESLCAKFNFTSAEWDEAILKPKVDGELHDHVKTVFHETTHLIHTVTTPFGLFLYATQRLQMFIICDVICKLRSRGMRIQPPLAIQVSSLSAGPIREEVEYPLKLWYALELFVLFMMGENKLYMRQWLDNPYLRGETILSLFPLIQSCLARHYNFDAKIQCAVRGEPTDGSSLPFASFTPEPFDPAEEGLANTVFAMNAASNISVLSIIESAGTTAEYWGCTRLSFAEFKELFPAKFPVPKAVNRGAINFAVDLIPASSLREFVLTYLTICELALFAPVLPHHQPLRKSLASLSELVPYVRWMDLLFEAGKVAPMSEPDDYERYTTELCGVLGWVPPKKVVDLAVGNRVTMAGDLREEMYVRAQHYRRDTPWIFLDYPKFIFAGSAFATRLGSEITFPVIQFNDKVLFHKDKSLLQELREQYLMRQVMRRILLRKDLRLRVPYRAEAEHIASLEEDLRGFLERVLGEQVPGLVIECIE